MRLQGSQQPPRREEIGDRLDTIFLPNRQPAGVSGLQHVPRLHLAHVVHDLGPAVLGQINIRQGQRDNFADMPRTRPVAVPSVVDEGHPALEGGVENVLVVGAVLSQKFAADHAVAELGAHSDGVAVHQHDSGVEIVARRIRVHHPQGDLVLVAAGEGSLPEVVENDVLADGGDRVALHVQIEQLADVAPGERVGIDV